MLLNLESQPTSNADFTPIISKNWLNSQNIKQSAPKTQNFPKLRKRLPKNALESPGFLKISPNLSTFSKRPSCWCLQLLQQFLQAKSFARPSLPFPSAFLEDVTHVFSHGAGAPREVGVGGKHGDAQRAPGRQQIYHGHQGLLDAASRPQESRFLDPTFEVIFRWQLGLVHLASQ